MILNLKTLRLKTIIHTRRLREKLLSLEGFNMISIIAAIGKNRELGKDNKLLWHIPEDLKDLKL